jgi:serine/threonine-protein kinase HipA
MGLLSEEESQFSRASLRLLNPRLEGLKDLPFSQAEQIMITKKQTDKISVQGVQPKFSAKINISQQTFEIVDKYGQYILKPQNPDWPELPENESFTMRMAAFAKLEIPPSGLVRCSDNSLSYFIKRFDRTGRNKKLHIEDFAQLAELDRDTKYNYSVEKLLGLIAQYCTIPKQEYEKFIRLFLFNFLFGNEDMHLKNYSIITKGKMVKLAPAYDLLNSVAALRLSGITAAEIEESALPLNGKKKRLKKRDFEVIFERTGLPSKVIERIYTDLLKTYHYALSMLKCSFMSDEMKRVYEEVLHDNSLIVFA